MNREAMQGVLDRLANGDVFGAMVITRDGLPALQKLRRPVSPETVAAMGAAMFGAAQAALSEWGEAPVERGSFESGAMRLSAASLDADHLLLLVANATVDPAKLAKDAGQAVRELAQAMRS